MADFDDLLARIGMQIEEMKKRIQASRARAEHHRVEGSAHPQGVAPPGNEPRQTLHPRAENRHGEPVKHR